jgi:hypothetical protein
MEESVAFLLDEIRERIELLESSLPKRIDGMGLSPISKLPYKALLYREALIWRMAELSREALERFEKNKLVSGIVLARAAIETTAALWYLCTKVESVVTSGVLGNIDDYLMQLTMGNATEASATDSDAADPIFPRPVKVRAFLKQVEKEIEGFSHQYGILSEYVHPNWSGTALLYSKSDAEFGCTIFGQNLRGESTRNIGVGNLSVALLLFEKAYGRIGELMPRFIELCESRLQKDYTPGAA